MTIPGRLLLVSVAVLGTACLRPVDELVTTGGALATGGGSTTGRASSTGGTVSQTSTAGGTGGQGQSSGGSSASGSTTGSTSTVCADASAAVAKITQLTQACSIPFQPPFSAATCAQAVGSCSAADQAGLEAFFSCVNALPTPACGASSGGAIGALAGLVACEKALVGVSPSCTQALQGSGATNGGFGSIGGFSSGGVGSDSGGFTTGGSGGPSAASSGSPGTGATTGGPSATEVCNQGQALLGTLQTNFPNCNIASQSNFNLQTCLAQAQAACSDSDLQDLESFYACVDAIPPADCSNPLVVQGLIASLTACENGVANLSSSCGQAFGVAASQGTTGANGGTTGTNGGTTGGTGGSTYCQACTTDGQCGRLNACLTDPVTGGTFCGTDCSNGQTCPPGASCSSVKNQRGRMVTVCAPNACGGAGGTTG